MTTNYGTHLSQGTPQTERANERQVKNNAGGYVYGLDPFARLQRFLIMGVDSATYYVGQTKLIRENAQCAEECLKIDGKRVVDMVVEISQSGRAPKNDPALFILAMAAGVGNPETQAYALANLPKVARIGTHLFHFAEFVENFRGWGRALRRAVGNWYNDKELGDVVNQLLKYQQRDGWSNRDLFRLAHPKTTDPARQDVYNWVAKQGKVEVEHPRIRAFMEAMATEDKKKVISLITEHNLSREMIPTQFLKDPDVLRIMLPKMPMGALVRNLANLSAAGLTQGGSPEAKLIVEKLSDENALRKARIHPVGLLNALRIYQQGSNLHNSWTVNQTIANAIEMAFNKSFAYVEPANKNFLLGVDVSGSMGSQWGGVGKAMPALTARDVAAVMAMATMRTEPWTQIMAFNRGFIELKEITKQSTFAQVVATMSGMGFDATDCALPMLYALEKKIPVDAFCVYTDNETWAGRMQPMEALKKYRKDMNLPNAKLIVTGVTATDFTIADPLDGGALDVVGFDASAPAIISDFVRD